MISWCFLNTNLMTVAYIYLEICAQIMFNKRSLILAFLLLLVCFNIQEKQPNKCFLSSFQKAMLASGLPVFCFSNCLENGSSAQGMFSGICWKKSMFKLGQTLVCITWCQIFLLKDSSFWVWFQQEQMLSFFYVEDTSLCCTI